MPVGIYADILPCQGHVQDMSLTCPGHSQLVLFVLMYFYLFSVMIMTRMTCPLVTQFVLSSISEPNRLKYAPAVETKVLSLQLGICIDCMESQNNDNWWLKELVDEVVSWLHNHQYPNKKYCTKAQMRLMIIFGINSNISFTELALTAHKTWFW